MKILIKSPRTAGLAMLAAVVMLVGWTMMPQLSVQPESQLWVEGTSTIHDWKMTVGTFAGSLTATDEAVEAVQLTVPVAQLKADNGTMNKKAYAALEAKKHPNISYKLSTAELNGAGSATFEIAAKGELTIAGVTKPVTASVKGEKLEDGKYRYSGSFPVLMSDFGVDPPTAMLGTIRTGDEVVVNFSIVAN